MANLLSRVPPLLAALLSFLLIVDISWGQPPAKPKGTPKPTKPELGDLVLPYDVGGVRFADLQRFLNRYTTGEARRLASEAIRRVPTEIHRDKFPWPGGSTGGGSNNFDQIAAYSMMWRIFEVAGMNRHGSIAARNAHEWVLHYLRGDGGHKDAAHSYLGGVRVFRRLSERTSKPKWAEEADEVLALMGGRAVENLKRYLGGKFFNTRLYSRALSDVATYLQWYRDRGLEPPGDVVALLRDATRAYLEDPLTLAPSGELSGWGVDVDGVPFRIGKIGKVDYWINRSNALHEAGFMAFSIQPYALFEQHVLWPNEDSLNKLRQTRVAQLREWFWKRGYRGGANPMVRGIGPSHPDCITEWVDVAGNKTKLAAQKQGGNLFYPCYWAARNEKDVRSLVEASILQHSKFWPDFLPQHLMSLQFLHMVARSDRGLYE